MGGNGDCCFCYLFFLFSNLQFFKLVQTFILCNVQIILVSCK
jgi:hypothetical protein